MLASPDKDAMMTEASSAKTTSDWWTLLCPMKSIDDLPSSDRRIVLREAEAALERRSVEDITRRYEDFDQAKRKYWFELPGLAGVRCKVKAEAKADGWVCELQIWTGTARITGGTDVGYFTMSQCLHSIAIVDEALVAEPRGKHVHVPWSVYALGTLRAGSYIRSDAAAA